MQNEEVKNKMHGLFAFCRSSSEQVARLVFEARRIALWLSILFIVSVGFGYANSTRLTARLKDLGPTKAEQGVYGPLIHPEIQYRVDEMADPRLAKLTAMLFVRNAWRFGRNLYVGTAIFCGPILVVYKNGFILGALLKEGGFLVVLHRVLPHGLFEVPTMLLVSAISGLLALRLYRGLLQDPKQSLLEAFKGISLTYAACLAVLFVCAILEGYGTRLLWGW